MQSWEMWVALAGIIGILAKLVWDARKDRREGKATDNADVAAALAIKDELIASLKEDREELRTQLKDSLEREKALRAEIQQVRQQVSEIEKDSRQTLLTVLDAIAESDRCKKAKTGCADWEPVAERRSA